MRGLREYITGARALSRNVWLFLLAALVMGTGRQIFMVLRNQYLVDLGMLDQQVTSVQGFNSIGGLLIAIPAVAIIGRFKAKRLLAVIVVMNAIGFATQGLFGTLQIFQMGAFAAGIAMSLNMALGAPFLMRNTSAVERIFGFAFLSAVSWPLSGFMGSLLAALMQTGFAAWAGAGVTVAGEFIPAELFGYRASLIAASALVLVALIPISLVKEPRPEGASLPLRALLKVHDKKRLLLLGLPEMVIGFGAGLTVPFFNVYFKNQWGLAPAQVAFVFMGMFAVLTLGYLIVPPLVRRFGPVKTIIATQLLSLPFFVELALANFLWLAVVAFIARQTLMNGAEPIYKQFAQEAADTRDRNAVAVAVHTSRHAFFTVANFVSGFLIAAAGGKFHYVITGTIICYLIAISLEALILPRLDRQRLAAALPASVVAPTMRGK
jgi:MFS family permease